MGHIEIRLFPTPTLTLVEGEGFLDFFYEIVNYYSGKRRLSTQWIDRW